MFTPSFNTELCIRCGLCVTDCVANCIDPHSMTADLELCIACGHCLAICPVNAVHGNTNAPVPEVHEPDQHSFAIFKNLVLGMRSIRQYTDQAVQHDHLVILADLVRYAPTGTNAQLVQITVVNSRSRVKALADTLMGVVRPLAKVFLSGPGYPLLRILVGKKMTQTLYNYRKEIDAYFAGKDVVTRNAHTLVVFHAPRKGAAVEQDAVIWAQTWALAAKTLGLGVCYNGILARGLQALGAMRRQISLPKGHKVFAVLTAGYPVHNYWRGVPRNPVVQTVLD
jgi:nitroreductase/NAD-dependent dihydropyrimidine dehydrogenase PreA subunit